MVVWKISLWANKHLGLGVGRIIVNIEVDKCRYSRQHLKPSTSDRPGRSYTRLCGVSTTSAAMRQDFKTPRDLIQ